MTSPTLHLGHYKTDGILVHLKKGIDGETNMLRICGHIDIVIMECDDTHSFITYYY